MPIRSHAILLALGVAGTSAIPARGQTPVTFTSQTVGLRVVLANHPSDYAQVAGTFSMELAAPPGGPITIRRLHITAPTTHCAVPIQGPPTDVTVSGFVADAASTPVSFQPQPGSGGEALFSGAGVPQSAAATVAYTASGLACQMVQQSGGQCSGPFALATPGANLLGEVLNAALAPPSGGQRALSGVYHGSFPLVAGATWGRVEVRVNLAGSVPDGPPSCPADFNGAGGLTVQDIFDFLSAWFAGSPTADFNHDGSVSVQDIFDFLSAWFAGCP